MVAWHLTGELIEWHAESLISNCDILLKCWKIASMHYCILLHSNYILGMNSNMHSTWVQCSQELKCSASTVEQKIARASWNPLDLTRQRTIGNMTAWIIIQYRIDRSIPLVQHSHCFRWCHPSPAQNCSKNSTLKTQGMCRYVLPWAFACELVTCMHCLHAYGKTTIRCAHNVISLTV